MPTPPSPSPESPPEPGRWAIGIDLGTTNSSLAMASFDEERELESAPETLPIPQLTSPGLVESRQLLPSALYLPSPVEFRAEDLALPWEGENSWVVGELAKNHGAQVPARLVSSAKSWLSYARADRRGEILPWNAPEEVNRLSPVSASAAYLRHLAQSFEQATRTSLSDNQPVLTVPASFDAVAQELTLEAAHQAGFSPVLLEEPQAALYAWLAQAGEGWRQELKVGDVILVVDIGGGTTDFSLIAVGEDEGNLSLSRVAVGDHLLLGGDNMDLALAYTLKSRLEEQGRKLDNWQFLALTHGARSGKEQLFGDPELQSVSVVVPGRGSGLVGGALRVDLRRADVDSLLVEGFLPLGGINEGPRAARRTGLSEINLPYTSDPAMTRHLAAFLSRQSQALGESSGISQGKGSFIHPTAILFNGGVLKAPALRQRLSEAISAWVRADGGEEPRVLGAPDLDLAVARGAAYYAKVREGRGIRIRGGTARAYYVGIESAAPAVPGMEPELNAVCIAPFGLEEGSEAAPLEEDFGLVVGEEASFRFFASSLRRDDQVGSELPASDPSLEEIPAIETTLDAPGMEGAVIPVRLQAAISELGLLSLQVLESEGERRWKLQFNVRAEE